MRKILLMGGGHAHLIAVPALAKATRGRAEISLVAPAEHLLYSGMMPGWIAGQYRFDDCAIHLKPLCEQHGVRWIEDRIVDIDFTARVAIGERGSYVFDLTSINVGSANVLGEIGPGAPLVLGAKPFAEFQSVWRERAASTAAGGIGHAVVVGGGAAAVEIAFALRRVAPDARVSLATAGTTLLQQMSPIAAALARRSLVARGVELLFDHRYVGAANGALLFDAKPPVTTDLAIVATGARPPRWLGEAASRHSVSVAPDGGIAIRSDLRSVSHAAVFAAGDCATFVDRLVPKSGVHALRQGPVLAHNLAQGLEQAPARPGARSGGAAPSTAGADTSGAETYGTDARFARFAPRPWTLALLNRCDGSAIAAWGPVGFAGGWVWGWKDRIDRRFMARFEQGSRASAWPVR